MRRSGLILALGTSQSITSRAHELTKRDRSGKRSAHELQLTKHNGTVAKSAHELTKRDGSDRRSALELTKHNGTVA